MSDSDTGAELRRRDVLRATGGALAAGALAGVGSANEQVEVNVGFSNPAGKAAAADAAASVKREFNFDAMTIEVPASAVGGLQNNPNIRYVEENGEMYAHGQITPYGIETVEADIAHDEGETGDGVSVAILDTGVDPNHEDLEANVGQGIDCGGGECEEGTADDDGSHGTHVAGTAGAIDNEIGVIGVGPGVTLHSVKVLGDDGGTFDAVAAGIEASADAGHEVQNMSLGGGESDVVQDALAYAAEKNVVMVASAGNDGGTGGGPPCRGDCVSFPATAPETIAVSATDENDDLASFSSVGPEVEIAAPGVGTLSTEPDDEYGEKSGTSMSAPHVAAAAAMLIADGTTDREEVRAQLKEAADDIGLDDNEQGEGRLNVADALGLDDDDEEDDPEESVSVATDPASDVGETLATLNGELTQLENADEADVGFEYGESGSGLPNAVDAGTLSSTGTFDATVDGLASGTEYEFRAVAETAEDADEGDVLTYSTDEDEEDDDETTAPVIDQFDLTDNSNRRWARVEVDWAVSDDDGALDEVTTEVTDWNSTISSSVSGSSASGTHEHRERDAHGEVEVTLTVIDEDGNTTSDTQSITLS